MTNTFYTLFLRGGHVMTKQTQWCITLLVQAIRADVKHNSSECGKSMKSEK